MTNLIFLPIKINIDNLDLNIETEEEKTFGGLWNTKFVSTNHPKLAGIVNQLPFYEITLIKYNTQAVDIPPHVDIQHKYVKISGEYRNIRSNEPSGYRILLSGSPTKLEVFDGKEWKIARLPSCPFAYIINSTETKHRIIGETGRKTLYIRGFLDQEKHQTLIHKNLEEFKDYAIYSQ